MKKKVKRRLKRLREKPKARSEGSEGGEEGGEEEAEGVCVLGDLLESCVTLKSTHKVKSLSFAPSAAKDGSLRLLAATSSNTLEVFRLTTPEVPTAEERNSFAKLSVLELHGHRSDVRSLCISYDGQLIASCSGEGTKIWSTKSFTCLRSCNTGYGVTLAFVTGNRYLVVGTKEGSLQLVDTASGEVTVDLEAAHEGAIWSIAMQPVDGKGFMTGGADKLVKFWDFSVTNGTLGVSLTKQLQMTHDILSVRYSPVIRGKEEDRVLVAVGLTLSRL